MTASACAGPSSCLGEKLFLKYALKNEEENAKSDPCKTGRSAEMAQNLDFHVVDPTKSLACNKLAGGSAMDIGAQYRLMPTLHGRRGFQV